MKNEGPLSLSPIPTHVELCTKKFQSAWDQHGKQDRKSPAFMKLTVYHVYGLSDHKQINHIIEYQVLISAVKRNKSGQGDGE